MNKPKTESAITVHNALAAHLGVDAHAIDDAQRFDEELAIDAFDLVLVALRFEELAPHQGDFPLDRLDRIATVRELVDLYDAWMDAEPTSIESDPATLRTIFAEETIDPLDRITLESARISQVG